MKSVLANNNNQHTLHTFLCLCQFLYGSANACHLVFLPIWFAINNFTYTQFGYITFLTRVTCIFVVPILCFLIDILANNNQIYKRIILSILCIIVAFGKLLYNIYASYNLTYITLHITLTCIHFTISNAMDSIILESIPNPNTYGKYRLWAAIGWGIVAFCLGIIFDYYLSVNTMYYFFNAFMLLLALLWLIPSIELLKSRSSNQSNKSSISFIKKLQMLKMFLKQMNTIKIQIIVSVFVTGMSGAVMHGYKMLLLEQLGASKMLMGTSLIITICSEVPAFWFAEYALNYFSPLGVMCIGIFAHIIRLTWYGCLTNPVYILPVELLHGLSFAWIHAAKCTFAHRIVNNKNINKKSDLSTFSQGFINTFCGGFGGALGHFIGGMMMDMYGPSQLFITYAVGLIPFLIIFVKIILTSGYKSKKHIHNQLDLSIPVMKPAQREK